MPNDGDIVDLIPLWLPDVDTQRQVLVDNPAGATLQELHASAAIAALFRGVAAFNLAGEILSTLFPEGAQGRASGISVAPGKTK
jgi:hypothetical protein